MTKLHFLFSVAFLTVVGLTAFSTAGECDQAAYSYSAYQQAAGPNAVSYERWEQMRNAGMFG